MELENMTVNQLRKKAIELDIANRSKMKKQELIDALKNPVVKNKKKEKTNNIKSIKK